MDDETITPVTLKDIQRGLVMERSLEQAIKDQSEKKKLARKARELEKVSTSSEPVEKTKVEMVHGAFGESIKQEFADQVTHKSEILGTGPVFMIIVGSSGSGKSTVLASIIPNLTPKMKKLGIATLIRGNSSHEAIERYCDENNIKFAISYTPSDAKQMITDMVNDREDIEEEQIGLIFDDFTNFGKSRENQFNQIQTTAFSMLRNYGLCFICTISQSALNIPTLLRANSSHRIIFPMQDKFAFLSAKADVLNVLGEEASNIYDQIYRKLRNVRYSFMLLRCSPPTLYFKEPDKDFNIIFQPGDEEPEEEITSPIEEYIGYENVQRRPDMHKRAINYLAYKIRAYHGTQDKKILADIIRYKNAMQENGIIDDLDIADLAARYDVRIS